jgi:sec-independent protein translocase protein TatC
MTKKYEDKEMPFLDHLDELRSRIIRSLIALIIGAVLCLIFSNYLLNIMLWPTTRVDLPLDIQNLKIQGMFIVKLEIAFFGGIIIALPYILYQIWMFVAPGLYKKERAYVPRIITFGTFLFLVGVAFAFTIIFPFALNFFMGLAPEGVSNIIAIDFYFGFLIRLLLAFGIVFELPILSYFLSKMGILTPEVMRKYRKHAIVLIFVLAALFTPPDPFTQVMLGIPLILLYELSIFISLTVNKGKEKREENSKQDQKN